MKYLFLFLALCFSGSAFAGDVTTESLARCNVLRYQGASGGPTGNQHTFTFDGAWFYAAPGLSLTSATQEVCNKAGVDFGKATDPYNGMPYNARISEDCAYELTKAGVPPSLCNAIIGNASKALKAECDGLKAVIAGELTTYTLTAQQRAYIAEGEAFGALQEQVKAAVYAKYPRE